MCQAQLFNYLREESRVIVMDKIKITHKKFVSWEYQDGIDWFTNPITVNIEESTLTVIGVETSSNEMDLRGRLITTINEIIFVDGSSTLTVQ